jgi:hypothetical protein
VKRKRDRAKNELPQNDPAVSQEPRAPRTDEIARAEAAARAVARDLTFSFVDGAVSVYNNPAFLLFVMATLPEYRLGWEMGEDKMLLVSIGTGTLTAKEKRRKPSQMTLLYHAKAIPAALIDAALNEQDLLCRVFGRCRFGDPYDREVGDLIVKKDEDVARSAFAPKRFTYVRYNPIISEDGLRDLGFDTIPANHVQPLDSADHMPELMAVGKVYARRVALSHFGPFAPTAHT